MLYNVTTMATTWHTVATRDVSLLKKQLDIVNALPREYVFLNYLRCHDDIGWGLDYETLRKQGMEERAHKKYLNDYFQGYAGESSSRGELYNADPVTGDARFCGTTASMCGIEKAGFRQEKSRMGHTEADITGAGSAETGRTEKSRTKTGTEGKETVTEEMENAVRLDVMLHAYMFMQSGIPVIYSGDEIGQLNDYSYKEDPAKAPDSRYLHRGAMNWTLAANIGDPDTVEGKIFGSLSRLELIRKRERAFVSDADTWTLETGERAVLGMGRYSGGETVIGLFNFSEFQQRVRLPETEGCYRDLISGREAGPGEIRIPAYGFYYLKKER